MARNDQWLGPMSPSPSPQETIADLRAQVARLEEELSAWHQEFTTTVNGKPYVMDALEAGKKVQDAEAEARMAVQDDAEQRALAERLRGAGVTDYSSLGINRVDCHFCPGVWRADEPAKHKTTCPLAKAQEEGNGG